MEQKISMSILSQFTLLANEKEKRALKALKRNLKAEVRKDI